MFGNLNNEEIENVLQNQIIGRIGCHTNGTTYVVPTSYAYDGTYIYGHSSEGMKIEMMRKNPQVCFEVDILENMAHWRSVITWGEFEEVVHEPEREKGLQILLNRKVPFVFSKTVQLTPDWPFHSQKLNDVGGIVFRIRLTKKTGRFEKLEKPDFIR